MLTEANSLRKSKTNQARALTSGGCAVGGGNALRPRLSGTGRWPVASGKAPCFGLWIGRVDWAGGCIHGRWSSRSWPDRRSCPRRWYPTTAWEPLRDGGGGSRGGADPAADGAYPWTCWPDTCGSGSVAGGRLLAMKRSL